MFEEPEDERVRVDRVEPDDDADAERALCARARRRPAPDDRASPRDTNWVVGGLLVATAAASTAALIRMLDRDDRPATGRDDAAAATPMPRRRPVAPQPKPQPPPQPQPQPLPAVATAPAARRGGRKQAPVTVERKREPRAIVRKAPAAKPAAKRAESTKLKKRGIRSRSFAAVETKLTPDAGVPAAPPPPPAAELARRRRRSRSRPRSRRRSPSTSRRRRSSRPSRWGPGTLDAMPSIQRVTVDGSLTTSEIESALARTLDGLRGCYRSAASSAKKTPDLTIKLSFEIDEGARASRVRVGGDTLGLAGCVSTAVGGCARASRPTSAPSR